MSIIQIYRWGLWFAATVFVGGALCLPASAQIQLKNVTGNSGVQFQHFSGGTGKHFILETVTAGVVTFDYNQDGRLDIYLLNGAPLLGAVVDSPPKNRLFRNDGAFQFTDVTDASGAGDLGFALGAVAGDYDNDGDTDLFISNYGPVVLLENDGCGAFLRRTFDAPLRRRIGAGLALLDIENDGDLDLYVANYVDFDFDKDVNREIFGVPAAPGPKDYLPDHDSLYRNDGNGQFADVSVSSGIAAEAGPGMGVVAFDYDSDGDCDVFVCNDSAANFLFENLGNGTFEESALLAGVAYDVTGGRQATMGVDVADWNRDGFMDLVTTNFVGEIPTLYENSGVGYFDDIGAVAGLGVADRSVTWGVGFADFDNDGWEDLFVAAGHLIAGVASVNDSEKFESPNVILRNALGKKLIDQTKESADSVGRAKVSRGVALDDLDSDGLLDVVVLDLNSQPQILKNVTQGSGGSIEVLLVGTAANRSAAGARVRVYVEAAGQSAVMVKELVLGRGYQGHFGSRLHFGLGSETAQRVEVVWPGGAVQEVAVPVGSRRVIVVEREGG